MGRLGGDEPEQFTEAAVIGRCSLADRKDHIPDANDGQLYCAIGKAVSLRPEKGAAVAAAKYLAERYPNAHVFSPRNVRRMRDFYRIYESHPALLTLALQIDWTQNVVIMEADLSMELCEWYLRAAKQFGWSKAELIENFADNAHEKIVLAIGNNLCYTEESEAPADNTKKTFSAVKKIRYLLQKHKCLCRGKQKTMAPILRLIFIGSG